MRRPLRTLPVLLAALGAGVAHASDLKLDGQTLIQTPVGTALTATITAGVGMPAALLADLAPGPSPFLGDSIPLGLTSALVVVGSGPIPASGTLSLSVPIPNFPFLAGLPVYFAAAVVDPGQSSGFDFSNGAVSTLVNPTTFESIQLAGRSLARYPYFEFERAHNEGTNLQLTIDPSVHPFIAGKTADVYVTDTRTAAEWDSNPVLTDVSGDGAETVTFAGPTLRENTIAIDLGTLDGGVGPDIGVGFDVVVDVDRDGLLGPGDYVDGSGDESGLYIVHDLTLPGPYPVTEILYSGGSFLGQNTFYPTNIASLGVLPLIVVSHGNGHNYQWYDHLGNHLASYGFVVMSHENNTVPGIETASTTTLTNTDYFLGNLDLIAGGILLGHVDGNNIGWIGHSRGGEGVARAYDRLLDGDYIPENFTAADIHFISSIAPTDFLGTANSNPHNIDYHLWVGGADADVSGCVSSDITQSYHLLDRAQQQKQSISLHGVGHGDFHNGGGSSVASGPCLVGRPNTHTIMRGYALPLFKYHLEGNIPSKDFLWRQWEGFHPIGAPVNGCIVVDLQFREGDSSGKLVIDDFQTNVDPAVSSSGEAVTFDVLELNEGRMDDPTSSFTFNANEPWNGFSQASASDTGRGVVFTWDSEQDRQIAFDVPPAGWDTTAWEYLSFRAAQGPRHTGTIGLLSDTIFQVELEDGSGGTSRIFVSAWNGGIEEPYQRTGCGTGTGWGAEFETVRVRLDDFLHDATGLDLTDVRTVRFLVGPSHGSFKGRIALDDLELTTD